MHLPSALVQLSAASPIFTPLLAASAAAEWVGVTLVAGILAVAVAGAVAAFRAMLHFQALLDLEQEQAAELHQERRRAQAAQIAVVATRTAALCNDPNCLTLHSKPAVEVVNTSEQPIFQVTLTNPQEPGARRPTLAVVPPMVASRRSRPTLVTLQFESVLPHLNNPRFREHLETRAMTEAVASEILDEWESVARPSMEFTDAAGQQWRRTADGGLEQAAAHAHEPTPAASAASHRA